MTGCKNVLQRFILYADHHGWFYGINKIFRRRPCIEGFLAGDQMPFNRYLHNDLLLILHIVFSQRSFFNKIHIVLHLPCPGNDFPLMKCAYLKSRQYNGLYFFRCKRNELFQKRNKIFNIIQVRSHTAKIGEKMTIINLKS